MRLVFSLGRLRHLNLDNFSLQVDFDESHATGRFIVRPNVDPDLDTSKVSPFC